MIRPWMALGALALVAFLPGAALAEPERTLLVVLDAVPFRTVERLTARGAFRDFAPPVPLVSTFPSSTSIALPGILGSLGMAASPGYEPRFYDHGRERRRGGGLRSYFTVEFPWRKFFDWSRPGVFRNALHAARPVKAGIREFGRALEAFAATDSPLYTVYLADTDTAGHLRGPDGLDPMLESVDSGIAALRGRTQRFRVILLSDHGLAGGDPLVNVLPSVRAALAAGGWLETTALRRPEDVVLTPYGLVSSFEAYSAPEVAVDLAGHLAAAPGVDVCAVTDETGWRIEGGEYTVEVERRRSPSGAEWRWRTSGDRSAGLPAVLASVGADGDWVSDERLFAETVRSAYPDPLQRVAHGFEAVDNPASVVCSVSPGHMFGARATERAARWTKGALRWTHGGLGREASLGFLLAQEWPGDAPSAVRYDRALEPLLGRGSR